MTQEKKNDPWEEYGLKQYYRVIDLSSKEEATDEEIEDAVNEAIRWSIEEWPTFVKEQFKKIDEAIAKMPGA
jgi:hypothetical protein